MIRIALLRAIGPETHRRMTMAQLRDACAEAGLAEVRTLLATGNLIFVSDRPESDDRASLREILDRHRMPNVIFLRNPNELRRVLDADPFPFAARQRPGQVLVHFLDQPLSESAATAVAGHAGPERIGAQGREVVIDYADGVARSRLTGARLDRMLGQTGTARNWNTVAKLAEAGGA